MSSISGIEIENSIDESRVNGEQQFNILDHVTYFAQNGTMCPCYGDCI